MARYGGGSADVGYRADLTVGGHAFEVWDAATGGSRVTDLRDRAGTAADVATSDEFGALTFEAPDHDGDLYVIHAGAPAGAPRVRILPADIVAKVATATETASSALAAAPAPGALDALAGRVAGVETQAAALPALTDRVEAAETGVSAVPDLTARVEALESAPAPEGGTSGYRAARGPDAVGITLSNHTALTPCAKWTNAFPADLPVGGGIRFLLRFTAGHAALSGNFYIAFGATLGNTYLMPSAVVANHSVRSPLVSSAARPATLQHYVEGELIRSGESQVHGRISLATSWASQYPFDLLVKGGIMEMGGLSALGSMDLDFGLSVAWSLGNAANTITTQAGVLSYL